jgi:hypothetical protein
MAWIVNERKRPVDRKSVVSLESVDIVGVSPRTLQPRGGSGRAKTGRGEAHPCVLELLCYVVGRAGPLPGR